jgi:hypothetical protein
LRGASAATVWSARHARTSRSAQSLRGRRPFGRRGTLGRLDLSKRYAGGRYDGRVTPGSTALSGP